MRNSLIIMMALVILLGLNSCEEQEQCATVAQEKEDSKEYTVALGLVKNFAACENQHSTKSKSVNMQIKKTGKKTIYCCDALSTKGSNIKTSIDIYSFSLENNGVSGFAMATGDPRIAQVVAYVENGSLADTTDMPEFAFVLKSSLASLQYDLIKYYENKSPETKNNDKYTYVNFGPFVKTTWNTGSPYNNRYDIGGCSSPNQRYKASSSTIACAQAIVANPKRPSGFLPTYDIQQWIQKPEVSETDFYAPQVADFIYGLEGGTKLGCDVSYSDLLAHEGGLVYNGYFINESYTCDIWFDGKIIENLNKKYCTVVGGQRTSGELNEKYGWVIDGVKGRTNNNYTDVEIYQVHCVYSYGGKGNGWFKNPFNANASDGKGDVNFAVSCIYFNPF